MNNLIFIKNETKSLVCRRKSKINKIFVFFRYCFQKIINKIFIVKQFLFKKKYSYNQTISQQSFKDYYIEDSRKEGEYLVNQRIEYYINGYNGNKQVFLFTMHPYYTSGGGQRGAQLARAFAQKGYDVIYIYSSSSFYLMDRDFIDDVKLCFSTDNFQIYDLKGLCKNVEFAIFEFPSNSFILYLEFLRSLKIKTIYDEIDNWDTELGNGWFIPEIRNDYINEADYLTASCKTLCERMKKESNRNIVYIPNACENKIFNPDKNYARPIDMPIGKCVIIYYGHLAGEWQDWNLLFNVAEQVPEAIFILIGYGKIQSKRTIPKNVLLMGPKKQIELPAYLKYSNFTVLHFKNSDVGKYVSPIKIFEYLAMKKPVLATGLPDIIGYPNVVYTENGKEWVHAIKNGIIEEDYTNFNKVNTWSNRADDFIRIVS